MGTYSVAMKRHSATTHDGVEASARDLERADFLDLVRSQDQKLRMLAYRLLGDAQAMDDVLQEAYLHAYEAMPSFRNDASAATWLYRITYNACLDYLRRRQREAARGGPPMSLENLADAGLEPGREDAAIGSIGARMDLAEALASLPVPQRAAVILVDALGYDYATAAAILGLRPGTVASRLHAARRILRTTLSHSPKEGAR